MFKTSSSRARNTCSRPSPSTAWDQGWMVSERDPWIDYACRRSVRVIHDVSNICVIHDCIKRKRERKGRLPRLARNMFIYKLFDVSLEGLLFLYAIYIYTVSRIIYLIRVSFFDFFMYSVEKRIFISWKYLYSRIIEDHHTEYSRNVNENFQNNRNLIFFIYILYIYIFI